MMEKDELRRFHLWKGESSKELEFQMRQLKITCQL
jgi:hypothetical protein